MKNVFALYEIKSLHQYVSFNFCLFVDKCVDHYSFGTSYMAIFYNDSEIGAGEFFDEICEIVHG
jgi:hypothetical protein